MKAKRILASVLSVALLLQLSPLGVLALDESLPQQAITSAFRTAAHNKNVKGTTYSQHCYGKAADIRVQGVSVEAVADYAETLLKNTGGIGRYPVKKGRPAGWVHVDVREAKSRWTL